MNKEYTILKSGTPIVIVDSLELAIQMIRNLESGMDRLRSHSPYTIKEVHLPAVEELAK
jgi:hypothetical protein